MSLLIQVENDDGTWSVLTRGGHGQPRQELNLMADRWRASLLFGGARVRVVDERLERRVAQPAALAR